MKVCVGCRTYQYPSSFEDVVLCRMRFCLLLQFLAADGVRPANPENPSKAAVDEFVDSLYDGDGVLRVSAP